MNTLIKRIVYWILKQFYFFDSFFRADNDEFVIGAELVSGFRNDALFLAVQIQALDENNLNIIIITQV